MSGRQKRGEKKSYRPMSFESAAGADGCFIFQRTKYKDTSAGIYESMLLNPRCAELSDRQFRLYVVCKSQYFGKRKPSRDYPNVPQIDEYCFYMNWGLIERYRIYPMTSASNFYKDMQVLIDKGFIERVVSGKAHRQRSVYRFCDRWHSE